jgi:hypothetical protein
MMAEYQSLAPNAGADPLGYYVARQAYAQMQVVEQAIAGTGSLDDARLAQVTRDSSFKTVVGDVKFGKGGGWSEARVLQVQYQNIKGADLSDFKDASGSLAVESRIGHAHLSLCEGETGPLPQQSQSMNPDRGNAHEHSPTRQRQYGPRRRIAARYSRGDRARRFGRRGRGDWKRRSSTAKPSAIAARHGSCHAVFRAVTSSPAISDARRRLQATRWPERQTADDWRQGAPLATIKALAAYWRTAYDWRRLERRLNAYPQFRTEIDGLGIHFLHVRSPTSMRVRSS